MRILELGKIDDPDGFIEESLAAYIALKQQSEASNRLFSWMLADAMIASLKDGEEMLRIWRLSQEPRSKQTYWYNCSPRLQLLDQDDSLETIQELRFRYVPNVGAFA